VRNRLLSALILADRPFGNIEKGAGGVAIAAYAQVLFVLGHFVNAPDSVNLSKTTSSSSRECSVSISMSTENLLCSGKSRIRDVPPLKVKLRLLIASASSNARAGIIFSKTGGLILEDLLSLRWP
jgi:hypothetical protein